MFIKWLSWKCQSSTVKIRKILPLVLLVLVMIMLSGSSLLGQNVNYLNESTVDKDDRMAWWRDGRIGMFIHWGLYAVPAGQWNDEEIPGIGEWIMTHAQIPVEQYEKLTDQFNPVKFDADEWVKLAKAAGMKYIVITSKHHDGFGLWDSKVSDYDIIDNTPYKKDILQALANACKKHGIKFCFYYSIMDWHHPDYLPRREWEDRSTEGADFQRYIAYMKAQLKELITEYDPEVIWFDGEWEDTWTHEEGLKLYNYVRSLKPDIIINNRVDKGRQGMQGITKEGDFAGDFGTPEQEIPETGLPGVDWESCMTMNDTWGFKTNDHNWKSTETLIYNIIDIISKGGNYLLNVGPAPEGLIPAESINRLQQIGKWMDINREAVYGTTAWDKAVYETESDTFLTRTDATIDFDWVNGPPNEKAPDNYFNVVWTGSVIPEYSEEYTFTTVSDDGVRLWIDDKLLIDNWTNHGPTEDNSKISLVAGIKYPVRMEYFENSGGAVAKLSWSSPSQPKQVIPAKALQGGLKGTYKSKIPQSLFFTAKGDVIYAITTKLSDKELNLPLLQSPDNLTVSMLGRKGNLKWNHSNKGISIDLSDIDRDNLPCEYAWVFKIHGF